MSKTVSVRAVRNDGKVFTVDGSDWGIVEIHGLDEVAYNLYTQPNAVGDGSTVTGRQTESREIYYVARLKNPNLNEAMRRLAGAFFLPKHTYKLTITYQGVTRWITGEYEDFKMPSGNVYEAVTITPYFLCTDPYFKSMDEFGKDIASVEPRFAYPLVDMPDGGGFVWDVFNFANVVELENNGDLDAFFRIYVEATDEVTNPCVMTSGGFVRIIDTMAAGDVYTIDCVDCMIYKNGENAIAKVDRKSDFTAMKLAVGGGRISFSADVGENVLKVRPYYNEEYGRM